MRAHNVDSNQKEVVAGIREVIGFKNVFHTHAVGRGFGDIVVGFLDYNYIFEIKDPNKVPSKQRLTEKEAEFHEAWDGQIDIIKTADDALRIIGAIL